MIYRFGRFELDEDKRELRRGGEQLALQPLIFDLLTVLLRHHQRVVSKNELVEALWPDVFVTEASLQRAVSLARSALNDHTHTLIRTYTGHGYRFCAEVQEEYATQDAAPVRRTTGALLSMPPIEYARTSDGVNIAFSVLGDGHSIVLPSVIFGDVHFHQAVPAMRKEREALAALGWRVVLYDGRATGSSDHHSRDYSLRGRIMDLEAVVDHLGLNRFTLFGSVHGGPTAIKYSTLHPERVSRLALCNAFASGSGWHRLIPEMRAVQQLRSMTADQWEFYTLLVANVAWGMGNTRAARTMAEAMRSSMTPEEYLAYREATEQIDVRQLLPRVPVKTLVVYEPGVFTALDTMKEIAGQIPGAQFVSTRDVPKAIDRFLRDAEETELGTPAAAEEGAQ